MPGRMPQKKPIRIDRITANLWAMSSAKEGKSTLSSGALYDPVTFFSAWTKISETAKKPRIAGMKWMPARR